VENQHSASLSISTIWVSLNFDFRMTAPDDVLPKNDGTSN
jgi:hypothetical protein